jgi:mRNA-degrading endonuclease RelE of RelBE toxin-antitoxin system
MAQSETETMTNNKIHLVRSAVRQIQKLPHRYFEDVSDILIAMNRGDRGDNKKLEGYKDLWRTRKGDTRVVWREHDNGILVVRGGKRADVYKERVSSSNKSEPIPLSVVLQIEEENIDELPTYEWNSFIHQSWYSFIYGDYLHSPNLTHSQQNILKELKLNPIIPKAQDIYSALVQSPAGTGKTVCSVLTACNFYQMYQWNTFIILPENLVEEIKKFSEVAKFLNKENFFIGTLREFFELISPENIKNNIATIKEEMRAFTKEALRVNLINNNHRFIHDQSILLSERELLLYRAFVDRETRFEYSNFSFYNENKKVIKKLEAIKPENIQKNLENGRMTWLNALRNLRKTAAIPFDNNTSLIVFDEAQDHSLGEYSILTDILTRWRHESRRKSCFILLAVGDKNQCVKPTDFDWGRLRLSKTYELKYNYRNTRNILEFANIFWNFANQRNKGNENLPEPSDPRDSFEEGEKVKLLECSSETEALCFLKILNDKMISSSYNEKSILSKLSKKLSIITLNKPANSYSDLEIINVGEAKGREFDACVAFCIFQGNGTPSIEEANNWYTVVTRSRSRLLVIATPQEINRIGRENLSVCEWHESKDYEIPLSWIIEWGNSDYLLKDQEAIVNCVLEGISSDPPEIYWDTYAAFRKANLSKDEINEIERKSIEILRMHPDHILNKELAELENIKDPLDKTCLKSLLLRSLNLSWQAVHEICEIHKATDLGEQYVRLINAIANDLEGKLLPYEAARVRFILDPSSLDGFPFADQVRGTDEPLVSLLCRGAISILNY